MNVKANPGFLAIPDPGRKPLQRVRLVTPGHEDPKNYIPPEGLHAAIDAAMLLGLPLLVTGEPGTGKTRAAYWLSDILGENEDGGAPALLRTDVKSTMAGRDLLYRFDEVARFRDSAAGGTPRPLIDYIEFEALGEAILRAAGGAAPLTVLGSRDAKETAARVLGRDDAEMCAADLLPGDPAFRDAEPCCRVVLIDELDKAPRDTPNDLLAEIENMAFAIPELGLKIDARRNAGGVAQRPIVIISSNSERDLPEPFLRRCAFFHIAFPKEAAIRAIVANSVQAVGAAPATERQLVQSATDYLLRLRDHQGLSKKPGTSEFLAWCECLTGDLVGLPMHIGLADVKDADTRDKLRRSLGCLVKTKDDLAIAEDLLQQTFSGDT